MILHHYFDVDHTITRRSTGRNFIMKGMFSGIFPFHLVLSLPLLYLRYRHGKLEVEHLGDGFPSFRGLERSALEKLSEEAYLTFTKRDVFTEALDLIAEIRSRGGHVYLASSSVDIILTPLAVALGVDGVIASTLDFEDGVCTGMFRDGPILGPQKCKHVLDHMSRNGLDPGECAFYSDSYHDIPILEEVAKPVATNPDRRLRRHAETRGWDIVTFSA